MVEIRYKDNFEVADLAGRSVAEAREQFKAEFGIPDKAKARLNGRKIKGSLEAETCLKDDDRLTFSPTMGKGVFLLGALLLALAITGSVFAYGWINATTTINVAAATSDFAKVSANESSPPSWTPYGLFKGTITGGTLFDIDTSTSQYPGDLVATVYIANGDELAKCYRLLAMKVIVVDSGGSPVDINSDNTGDDKDYVLLTLRNGAVDLFINQNNTPDQYTVKVKSGFYITHIFKAANWGSSYEDPVLFCEVAQR